MKIYLVVCSECVIAAFASQTRAENYRGRRQWVEEVEVDMTPEDNDFSTDDLSDTGRGEETT